MKLQVPISVTKAFQDSGGVRWECATSGGSKPIPIVRVILAEKGTHFYGLKRKRKQFSQFWGFFCTVNTQNLGKNRPMFRYTLTANGIHDDD